MIQFGGRLALTPHYVTGLWDGKNWELTEWFGFNHPLTGWQQIPPGFVTDGGTIPPPIDEFIHPLGKGVLGFVPHDWLYGTQRFDRKTCDTVLRDILIYLGFSRFEADSVYGTLRDFGELAWNEDKSKVDGNIALLGGQNGRPSGSITRVAAI